MKRLDERTVHLDDDEMVAHAAFHARLDEGDSIALAVLQVRTDWLRSGRPQLSDEFWTWLS